MLDARLQRLLELRGVILLVLLGLADLLGRTLGDFLGSQAP